MSESCKNCIYNRIGVCTNTDFKNTVGKEILIIENAENIKCEFYEDSR